MGVFVLLYNMMRLNSPLATILFVVDFVVIFFWHNRNATEVRQDVAIMPNKEVAVMPNKELVLAPKKDVAIIPNKEVAIIPNKEVAVIPNNKQVVLSPTNENAPTQSA